MSSSERAYRRASSGTLLRVAPVFSEEEARGALLGAVVERARERAEVDSYDEKRRAVTYAFASTSACARACEGLRAETRAETLGRDVARGDATWTCGFSERAMTRADEPTPTTARRSVERLDVRGLSLLIDFVSEEEEKELAALALAAGDETRLARRRVKHFGYAFDYGTRDANVAVEAIPELVMRVLRRLPKETPGYESAMRCDQVTVNEYPRGVGLAPHVDTHSAFGPTILSLSLLGDAVMEFRSRGEEHRALFLPRRSLLVMHSDARYRWQHYIPHRKFDDVEGACTPRGEVRLSYTFRERRHGPCECEFPLQCDSRGGVESKCSKRRAGETQRFSNAVGDAR